jgi:hypothetical protein
MRTSTALASQEEGRVMKRTKDSATASGSTERRTAAGRRQLLIYIDPELVKDVKRLAIDRDTNASSLIELAVREWVERQAKKKGKI